MSMIMPALFDTERISFALGLSSPKKDEETIALSQLLTSPESTLAGMDLVITVFDQS